MKEIKFFFFFIIFWCIIMGQEAKYMKIEELELLSSKISNINLLNSIVETFDNVPYEVRTRLL